MMKRSLIAILLCSLLAFAAYAANFTLTVTPASSSTTCDYGPNTTFPTGQIGTDLTAAGFTHCVMNADFTDNSGATTSGGWVMNNPNTYVNQCAGTAVLWKFWFMWFNGTGNGGDQGGGAPCNRLSIAADSTGKNALTYTFNPSDINQSALKIGFALYWPGCGQTCNGLNGNVWMPWPIYVEYTYYLEGIPQTNAPHIVHAFESSPFSNSTAFFDDAFIEMNSNGGAQTSMDNYFPVGQKDSKGFGWTTDVAHLHTWSFLNTSNNTTKAATCFYHDNNFITPKLAVLVGWGQNDFCQDWGSYQNGENAQHQYSTFFHIGDWVVSGALPGDLTGPITMHLEKMRVFDCPNYVGSSNNCFGTVVDGH